MKLGHVKTSSGTRLVVVEGNRQVEVANLIDEGPETLDDLLWDPQAWLARIAEALRAGAARGTGDVDGAAPSAPWLSPLQRPSAIIAIGLNYYDHCRELGVDPPSVPMVFAKLPASVIGDGETITCNEAVTRQVDWEAELAVVIGRETSNVSVGEADEAIFGYTIVNDVTACDIQRAEQQWVRAKSLNTFCPVGPVVVTRDEIPDPPRLAIASRVNDRHDSRSRRMTLS